MPLRIIKPIIKPKMQTSAPSVREAASEKPKGGIKRRERVPTIKTDYIEITGGLADVVSAMKKSYGPYIITRANNEKKYYGRLPSGILSVDLCLAGGLMKSRGSMIYGQKSAGKSTLAARFIAAAQRDYPDQFAIYIDIEISVDRPWLARQGVDLDRVLIVEPETGEMAVDVADALLRNAEVSMIVTDSIAMITPMKEIQSSAEDAMMGVHARLVGNYIRRINASLAVERHANHFPVVLHINQFRTQLSGWGDPRVLPGGKALEYATSQQIELSNHEHTNKEKKEKNQAGEDKEDKQTKVIFNEHSIKITKDKTGGRFKEGKFLLVRDDEATGLPVGYINQSKSIINFGLVTGVLSGSPQSFQINDGRFFQGKFRGQQEFVKWLVEHQDAERQLVSNIVEHYRLKWGVS